MHQLTKKKNVFSALVLSVGAMVEISNLLERFCFWQSEPHCKENLKDLITWLDVIQI